MRPFGLLSIVLFLGCSNTPEAANAPAPSASPEPTAPASPEAAQTGAPAASAAATGAPAATATGNGTAAAMDLSTPEKARLSIHKALERGDKEAFKKAVSRRILDRQKDGFDAWFDLWKAAAEKGPERFRSIVVTQEDGVYKLDEI